MGVNITSGWYNKDLGGAFFNLSVSRENETKENEKIKNCLRSELLLYEEYIKQRILLLTEYVNVSLYEC